MRRLQAGLRLAWLLLASAVSVPAAAQSSPVAVPYSVTLNGQPVGDAVLLKSADGRLLLRGEDWGYWRIQRPVSKPVRIADEDFWPLDEAPGFTARLDDSALTAAFGFAPSAFAANHLTADTRRTTVAAPPAGIGGFLNYDLLVNRSWQRGGTTSGEVNAQIETGLFSGWGVGLSQWVALDLADRRRLLRLDSNWRHDDPEALTSLQLGDSAGRGGLWGRAVRFGGLQWSRNFTTQPGFVTLPQPQLSGESALPSVIDLYVDGVRRERLDVPQGPFVIDGIPAVNGLGEVQLVVRDLLGREQILRVPYLSSVRQLRAGLHDYSYEVGALREDFGSRSGRYGPLAATATHRYGLSDRITSELRGELREHGSTGGLGFTAGIPRVGALSAAVAGSRERDRDGRLGFLAWERAVRRSFSVGARATFASAGFVQTGIADGVPLPKRVLAANAGFSLGRLASVGLAYVDQRNRQDQPDLSVVSASITARWQVTTLSLQAIHRLSPSQDTLLSLLLSMPLASRASSAHSLRVQRSEDGASSAQLGSRIQRNAPNGEGYGYRAAVFGDRDDTRSAALSAQGGASYNGEAQSWLLDAAASDDQQALRASVTGGVGAFAGHVFATRRISSSFGIVESGAPDIPLLLNNQRVARTDADGTAVIPNLQSYQANSLRVDTADLPLDVEVEASELTVTPYFRSGLKIALPIRRTVGALLSLELSDGRPVPAGATVRIVAASAAREFPVARAGQSWITGLAPGRNELLIIAPEGRCTLVATVPDDAGVQPRLGPFRCEDTLK